MIDKEKFKILNEDCIIGAKQIDNKSVDLIICDPPFGIDESKFDKHYNRKNEKIINGYVEAPNDYDDFTLKWLTECKRILKDNGSMYIISGWTNLHSFYKAIEKLDLHTINHIIWKYNFGVATKKKWVSSHYHIFYLSKKDANVKFIKNAYYSQKDKENNKSLQYSDMEDVWYINKEYSKDKKNQNKLPSKLIEKMINYSSYKDDLVCDFFMGSFTTAESSLRLGRKVIGFELNKESYDYYMPKLNNIEYGIDYKKPTYDNHYFNQGKKINNEERNNIINFFNELNGTKKNKIEKTSNEFGRGPFSILNIINKG